jgi:hypothetical protein
VNTIPQLLSHLTRLLLWGGACCKKPHLRWCNYTQRVEDQPAAEAAAGGRRCSGTAQQRGQHGTQCPVPGVSTCNACSRGRTQVRAYLRTQVHGYTRGRREPTQPRTPSEGPESPPQRSPVVSNCMQAAYSCTNFRHEGILYTANVPFDIPHTSIRVQLAVQCEAGY